MTILRNANFACLCRLIFPMPLSNLNFKKCPCHYLFGPHVTVAKVHVALYNFRNGHVALSILGVVGRSAYGIGLPGETDDDRRSDDVVDLRRIKDQPSY